MCDICGKPKRIGGSFFRVPLDVRRRTLWSKTIGITNWVNNVVCEDHFLPSDFIRGKLIRLMPSAVPSINIGPSFKYKSGSSQVKDSKLPTDARTNNDTTENMDLDAFFDKRLGMDNMLEISMHESEVPKVAELRVTQSSCETQTEPILLQCADVAMLRLKAQNKTLLKENQKLQIKLEQTANIMSVIKSIFTEGQVRKMIMNDTHVKWSWIDMSNAICLHAAGPRAYVHLYENGFPFPHVTTLYRWYRKVQIKEGIINIALDFLRHIRELTLEDKLCVLSFDERRVVELPADESKEEVATKSVQVAMARGLWHSWKQPMFFDFECKMDVQILNNIIMALQNAGFVVVAVVCKMTLSNQSLFKNLGPTIEQPWFRNPVRPGHKIFVFADAPQLLKLIKQHFLDSGLIWKGDVITTRAVEDVIKHSSSVDLSAEFKLTAEHLSATRIGKQKIELATQLFSNTTANAIRRCHLLGLDIERPVETADLLQLVNDWYGIFNTNDNTKKTPKKEPLGLNKQQQDILTQMNKFMSLLIVPEKENMQQFQKDVLWNNNALPMLYEYIESMYKSKPIMTNRLNLELLDHCFDIIRYKDGIKDNNNKPPTQKEFKYRLREYILARNSENFQSADNVEKAAGSSRNVTNTQETVFEDTAADFDTELEDLEFVEAVSTANADHVKEESLEGIAEFVSEKQTLTEHTNSSELSFTWMNEMF